VRIGRAHPELLEKLPNLDLNSIDSLKKHSLDLNSINSLKKHYEAMATLGGETLKQMLRYLLVGKMTLEEITDPEWSKYLNRSHLLIIE
jgi:hypothetical protein